MGKTFNTGRLGNGLFVDANGNVGINTTTPNYLLHINSSTTAAHIQLTNSDTGSTSTDGGRLFMSGLNMTLNNREAGYIAFETSDTERMRISATGNVGIGTTNPDNTYQGLTIYGSNPSVRLKGTSTGSWNWIEFVTSAGVNNFSMGVSQSTPLFAIKAGAGLDNPNFVMTSSGSIGIGTVNPSTTLHLSTTNGIRLQYPGNTGYAQFSTDVSNAYIFSGYDGERIRINSDGSIGFNRQPISARSFSFQAILNKPIVIEAVENAGVHSIMMRPNYAGYNLISGNYLSGGAYLPLSLSARENTIDLILQPNGNVCIGSYSDMGTKFQVNGANYIEMATFAATSASASAIISNNGGYVQFSNGSARHLSNAGVFTAVTDGIQVLKSGIVYVSFSQDITTTGTVGYVSGLIRKNGNNISENLITNTNGQWDGLTGVTTVNVAAGDIIGFYISASDITSFDPGAWSNYSFIWSAR